MTADWTVCRDRAGHLLSATEIGTAMHLTGPRAGIRIHVHRLDEFGPLVPVPDADGLPVVATVGDLTARHIGRRVRWGDDGGGVLEFGEGVLEFVGAGRRFECLLDLDGRESPRTFVQWLPLDTPCELLP